MLIFILAACGSDDAGPDGESESEGSNTETEETEDEGSNEDTEASEGEEETGEEMSAEENESTDASVGDTVSSDAGEMTLVSRTDDVGTFESGPITMDITKVNGVSGELSQEMQDYMEMEQVEYIQVDMEVSNSSEEDIIFYASQATMITDTGEQLESDMMLSDHIDGEFLGEVNKQGSSFYILENSKAEDVNSVTLRYDPASNSDYEDLGEELEIEVELER
ncbi:hypothetical protein [Halobacillus campisalis]